MLPLEGGCVVRVDGEALGVEGRDERLHRRSPTSPTSRATRALEIASERGGRFALPVRARRAPAEPRHVAAADVPVELRGAGRASRQVNNFCAPGGVRRPTG